MEKCIIVAVADNLAIGRGNTMPWHISADLKYFRKVTSGHPVIMGRKTYESIGRPLPGRTNIVVTRSAELPEQVLRADSLEAAYELARRATAAAAEPRCFVIGGGQLYKAAIDSADRLFVTHVHTVVEDAETFFPQIDPDIWELRGGGGTQRDEETGLEYEFTVYARK